MTINPTIIPAAIRKNFTVKAGQAKAFDVFTAGMAGWWLKSHTITKSGSKTVVVEPVAGGRWYEIGNDGEECDWGRVLDYSRPDRLVLSWQISADWQFDPALLTEVEVRFTKISDSEMRIDFEHRKLENYGAAAEQLRGVLDSDGGWTGLLSAYATAAAAA